MTRVRMLVVAVCVAVAIATSLLLLPVVHAQASTGVVISEFPVRGPNDGNDEFIELQFGRVG
jgi:hypothetical protein